MPPEGSWKVVALCCAVSTWCFLNCWVELAQGDSVYFARFHPATLIVLPVVCCQVLLVGLFMAAWALLRSRRDARWTQYLLLALSGLPAGMASVALLRMLPFDPAPLIRTSAFWPVAGLIALPLGVLSVAWPARALRLVRGVFLYSIPVLALIVVRAGFAAAAWSPADFVDRPLAKKLASPARARVVWIVFDELSRKFAFDQRPAGLHLPEFDRLRAQSIYASSAESPGDSTLECLPSLMLGRTVETAVPEGPSTLRLRLKGATDTFDWSSAPSVFTAARAMGYNTALTGWFHPWGRVLSASLTDSAWVASWRHAGAEEPFSGQSLPERMWFRLRLQIAAIPLLGHWPGYFPGLVEREEKIARLRYLRERATALASDPANGLVVLHLPAPHPPAVYDRATSTLAPASRRISYVDSLALADHVLGEIRSGMEAKGLWDRSAVIVSADHGWRANLWRGGPQWTAEDEALPADDPVAVPFLVKLPGQQTTATWGEPFPTVRTRALVEKLLGGAPVPEDEVSLLLWVFGG